MNACAKYLWTPLLLVSLVVSTAWAQMDSPPPVNAFTQQELDQMLAPIALYPDQLLSQILMASTYPLEVVEAARWSRANPELKGEQAVRAVDDRNWDPSVKSLVAFPQVLAMMDEKLDWTERLGDAFLAQQPQVMDSVQGLRQKAYAAGNLRSNEHYRVVPQGPTIVVESPYPEVIYVPYYDPLVVYGPWWWVGYPPIYWRPWPGYYARTGFVGFYWSVGITIGHGFFFGAFDWPHRGLRVVDVHPFYYHRFDRRPMPVVHVWQHEPEHRRGVPYRSPQVHEHFAHSYSAPPARREFRGPAPHERRALSAERPDAQHTGRVNHPSPERRVGDYSGNIHQPSAPQAHSDQGNRPDDRTPEPQRGKSRPDSGRDVIPHTGAIHPDQIPRASAPAVPERAKGPDRGAPEKVANPQRERPAGQQRVTERQGERQGEPVGERGQGNSQERGPDFRNRSGRDFDPGRGGGPRDFGESHHH